MRRARFEALLSDDLRMAVTVFRNLVGLVSAKIDEDNVRAFDYEEVKGRLTRKQQELAATEEILGERGIDVEELRAAVNSQVLKSLPRILVVDDEPEILRFFQRALAGYDVVTAEDGLQALEAIREVTPSLVIADINMPRMDGLQLLKELRDAIPGVPVIGLSGYVSADRVDTLGFDDFILKPIKVVGLRNVVSTHL